MKKKLIIVVLGLIALMLFTLVVSFQPAKAEV